MPNRREPLNLVDFTGGLNLRVNQFQLAGNESPQMENITIDPLGGIYSRLGWERWNAADIAIDPTTWNPRRAFLHQLADGTDNVYVAANNKIFMTSGSNTFTDSGLVANAAIHMADFTSYGDTVYVACGMTNQCAQRKGLGAFTLIPAAGVSTWNDDYTNPLHNVMPKAGLMETHAGYLFVARTEEDGIQYYNRVRWSHPTSQDDWAHDDYIDIGAGGSQIVALMSYEDHLLIFKADGIWALYGYDAESWQLIQKSSTIGATSPQSVSRSETAVFFYSASDRGGIYAYGGERPIEISEQLRYAMEGIVNNELIWVGWAGRKLWVTLPWTYDGPTDDDAGVFVFDPSIGENGAWSYYSSEAGGLGPIVSGSNIDSQAKPLAVLRNTDHPCIVQLNARTDAADLVAKDSVLGATTKPDQWDMPMILTDTGLGILMSGTAGLQPFRTRYRTPWMTADWPTRKKSWRRPDFVCRRTGHDYQIHVQSFRDYEEQNARRSSTVYVYGGGKTVWGQFDWGDGSLWGAGGTSGGIIRRGSSYGLARALQLNIEGATRGAQWGIDAVVLKFVFRRFH
jgi:hypothetical protein